MKSILLTFLLIISIGVTSTLAQSAEINGDFETFVDLTPLYDEAFGITSPDSAHISPDGYISITRFSLLLFQYVIFGVLPTGDDLEIFIEGAVGLSQETPGANGSNTAVGIVPDAFFNGGDFFGAFPNSSLPSTFSGYYKYEGNLMEGDTLFALSFYNNRTFLPEDISDVGDATAYSLDTLLPNGSNDFEFFESNVISNPVNNGIDTVSIFFLAIFDEANIANGNVNKFIVDGIGFDQGSDVCEQNGGVAGFMDGSLSQTICLGDGVVDPVEVFLSSNSGDNSAWVITDTSGEILELPANPPFDLEGVGAGTCQIWHLAFETGLVGLEIGQNTNNLDGCFDFSNPVEIIKNQPKGGAIVFDIGGEIATICAGDEESDPLDVTLVDVGGSNFSWLLTDTSGEILDLPMNPPFDLEGAGAGTCQIWHLAYEDGLTGLEVGLNANDLEGCFNISNSLTVVKNENVGGILAFEDGSFEKTICTGDGIADLLDVTIEGAIGLESVWVITDTMLNVLDLPTAPPFDFEGAGAGICLIWHLSHSGDLMGLEIGVNASAVEGCFATTEEPLVVFRNQPQGGRLTFENGDTTVTICVADGVPDSLNVTLEGSNEESAWVITDSSGEIIDLPENPPFDLEGTGLGTCFIWNVSYAGDLLGASIGSNANDLEGCFNLSNSLEVERVDSGPLCLVSTSDLPFGIDGVKLFPNPATDWMMAELEGQEIKILKAFVSSISGQNTTVDIDIDSNQLKMNVNKLEAGMYVLHIQSNKGLLRTTFVK